MCILFRSILAILLCSETLNAQVQVYPVSVTTRLTPPYSVNLADYAAPGSEQLKVIILQRDLTQAPYLLYLRMEIELNGRMIIRTSPEYNPPALTLDPGIPTVVSGTDLSMFFDPSHLEFTAYSRDAYMRTKTLPEGSYTITFTAYDHVRREVALSRGGSMFCYLAKTDPPMLNLPLNNAVVHSQDPQYINFQWLSRSVSSPNSAFSTAYRFELFEMRTGGNPGEVVQNTRPIYSCETDRTTFQYTISETPLIKGMRYAWRVKAFDRLGRDYIRNDGNSEVYSFLYDDIISEAETINFNEIQNFSAKAIGPRKALLKWDASPEYSSYKISYRENEKGKWFEDETDKDSLEVAGLTPGTVYDCKVQGRRGRAWGSYSENDTVKMPMLPVIECGNPFQPLLVSNRQPLPELRRMQQFDAGGFMVTVMDPYAASFSPGRFTGNGFVRVPLFGHKKLSCEFNDVFINTDYQMVEGSVRLLYNENNDLLMNLDDEFEGGGDNGKVKEGVEQADIILPDIRISDVKEIIPDIGGGEILIVKDGDTTHVDITSQLETNAKTVTVKDEAGNIYSVDAGTGNVTAMGKALPGGRMSLSVPSTIDSRTGIVRFERASNSKYAFDRWDDKYEKANLFTEEYEKIKMSDNDEYFVPAKLIPAGETDIVQAIIEKGKIDSLQFVSGTGTVYNAARNGNKYLLTLPAAKEDDAYEIFVMAKDHANNEVLLGKLLVVTYSVKSPKLVLVPVNGNGKDLDVSMIKEELNKIYHPVAVDWQVEKDTVFNPRDNTISNTLDVTGSGLFSQYTESMKALNNAFIEAKGDGFDETAIYLFMLNSAQSTSDGSRKLTGDMPRRKQFGYLFMGTMEKHNEAIVRTIAHEISHGVFHLNHTFDNQYRIPEGKTTNLMDYSAGLDLVKHQWDAIHDPGLVIGMFERDEEGANYSLTLVDQKHTLLFNHVYEKNHRGNLEYLQKIEKSRLENSTEKSIDLDYESKKEEEWVRSWKLRTTTSDEILSKIINKIQKAKKGEKIEKLSLFEKGIFIGKYRLEDVEYPIAVYSNKAEISNLVKIQVSTEEELEANEIKKYLKCEEKIIKYMVFSFYEEGASEPALMIQVEKFDISKMQNTKIKFLDYLQVLSKQLVESNNSDSLNTIMDQQKIRDLYPKVDQKVIGDIFNYISLYKNEYGIDDCTDLIHFLTQADHETGGFTYMKEIKEFKGNREKYKGRGIFQLTWEDNYKKFQEHLKTKGINVDLINHPELLEESKYAVLSALWYWKINKISSHALDLKRSTALEISKIVNCGNSEYCGCEKDKDNKCKKDDQGKRIKCYDCPPNGWDDRKDKFEKYKKEIKCDKP